MAVPKYHEFMKPLLERLADGREHKLRDLYAALAQTFRLTEADRAEYLPGGKQPLYHNRIRIVITKTIGFTCCFRHLDFRSKQVILLC